MISAREAKEMYLKRKEEVIASYDDNKTDNLKIVEKRIKESIDKVEINRIVNLYGINLNEIELDYLRAKGYDLRMNGLNFEYNLYY